MIRLRSKWRNAKAGMEQIVAMLGTESWNSTCPNECPGCKFEMEETLRIAYNVLAGKPHDDHWVEVERGDVHPPGKMSALSGEGGSPIQ